MDKTQCMLTTYDNPYNPFEQFMEWYMFDLEKGYDCCAYLDRVTYTSEQLSDQENGTEIEQAIDEAIALDFRNVYTKVYAK